MARISTYPDVLSDLIRIDISKFKIKARTFTKCTLSFKNVDFECSIVAKEDGGVFRLETKNGKPWIFNLHAIESNLGLGCYYVFECPITKKTCRKLYFYEGKFQHRNAIPVNYSKQNEGKRYRELGRLFRFELGYIGEELCKPYSKTHYRGIPTKRYARILKQIENEEKFYRANAAKCIQQLMEQGTPINKIK